MKRTFLVGVFILSAAAISFGQSTFYYPHVANGVLGGVIWKTTILLTNPAAVGTATASGTITFTKDNIASNNDASGAGSAFTSINFVDDAGVAVGTGGNIPFQIAGGQSRKFTSTGVGIYAGGFATVTSNVAVTGTAIFSEFTLGGQLIGEAGVPAGAAVTRQIVFVDTLGSYNLGVALANPTTNTSASVTLNLLNTSAVTVNTTTTTLGSGNHLALFTSQLFPTASQLAGTMQVVSAKPLATIALRFDPSFSVFTTLPPVTIASLSDAAAKWFEQRPWTKSVVSLSRLMASLNLRWG